MLAEGCLIKKKLHRLLCFVHISIDFECLWSTFWFSLWINEQFLIVVNVISSLLFNQSYFICDWNYVVILIFRIMNAFFTSCRRNHIKHFQSYQHHLARVLCWCSMRTYKNRLHDFRFFVSNVFLTENRKCLLLS